MLACALLKELHYLEDTQGVNASLHYVRTKDGKEIDFLICIDNTPKYLIDIKNSDDTPAPAFQYFSQFLSKVKKVQLVKSLAREKTYPDGLEIRALIPWLAVGPELSK